MFMIRRLLFVGIAFILDHQALQIISLIFLNTAIIIYQENNRPLKVRHHNSIEIFNEVTIHLVTMHLVFFTDWVPDMDMQYSLGWSMLVVICVNLGVNLSIICYFGGKQIYLLAVRYVKRLLLAFGIYKPNVR